MQQPDLLRTFLEPLERGRFPYMVTGSVATTLYGAPRLTHDVDLVLQINADRVDDLVRLFPAVLFYCPPTEVIVAELQHMGNAHFNLIHHASGFKADIYPLHDALHRWGMERRRRIQYGDFPVWVAPPEYVILRKLEFFLEGGSEKHLLDIQKVLAVEGASIDKEWIKAKVAGNELEMIWKRVAGP